MALAGQRLLVIARDEEVTVFGAKGLARRLRLDPTRRYQPNGKPLVASPS